MTKVNIWLEILGSFPEREGKYLICPVHTPTKKNYPIYRVLEELKQTDLVFHYVLAKAGKPTNAISSYSRVKSRYTMVDKQDALCSYPPPYRKVELYNNIRL